MKTIDKGPGSDSAPRHISDYQGPVYWLRTGEASSIPDLLLTYRNTRIHRFGDSELDHLRISDLTEAGIVWVLKAKLVGEAILTSLEDEGFPVSREPIPDNITEDWFVSQSPTPPPDDFDPVA